MEYARVAALILPHLPVLRETFDFSGKKTVRKEIERARAISPIGYGTTMMTWRTESWFLAVRNGSNWNMTPQGEGPKNNHRWGSGGAIKALCSKTHLLIWKLDSCLQLQARLQAQKHSWALGGRWIDDKHANLVPDADVKVTLHILVEGSDGAFVGHTESGRINARTLASRPSLEALLSAVGDPATMDLPARCHIYFSTEPMVIGRKTVG
ncbi:hypothetical protein FisN_18Hh283 [Fistulifera solaris]|uniref:Uncharacterized protein n=1 Tax=Fistulifera solaris TaxID=1519565 RepID=A0A1Z5KIU4_FISSO|nr:hypothetical protein FisN_18Hh283 [Fistulifera solaris]|eukprot:GAX26166.1 hypothetical protein FisN_18Hh283 [Fistulifera solaris]